MRIVNSYIPTLKLSFWRLNAFTLMSRLLSLKSLTVMRMTNFAGAERVWYIINEAVVVSGSQCRVVLSTIDTVPRQRTQVITLIVLGKYFTGVNESWALICDWSADVTWPDTESWLVSDCSEWWWERTELWCIRVSWGWQLNNFGSLSSSEQRRRGDLGW